MWIYCGMSLTPSTYLTQSVVLKVLIPISTIHHCYDFSKPEPDQNSNFVDPKKNQQHIPSLRKEELIQPICNRIISNINKCTPRYLSCVLCTWFYPHLRHECDASVDATFQTFKITLDIAKLNSSKSTAISLSHKNSNV